MTHLFTGQKWYSQLGILDLRNRAYLPSLGRFLQPDPIGFGGDASNLYRYCGNSPSNLSDPSGLFSLTGIWTKFLKIFSNNGIQSSSSSSSSSSWSAQNSNGDYYPVAPDGSNVVPSATGPTLTTDHVYVSSGDTIGNLWDPGFDRTAGVGDYSPFDGGSQGDGRGGGGGGGFNIDPHQLASYGPSPAAGARMRQFANVVDATTISYLGGVGVAAAAPAIGAASLAAVEAVPAVAAAVLSQAQPLVTYIYLGVVIPTSTLTVTNPVAHELLEEAYESWRWR
ncbi:MAG: RHS repeat-associated core domain-containing protein [Chthoniobacterales bacterium]|nr:RHS repeat-associated core domain-containing protein [Chthoniobacterales bacterium]